MLIAGNLVGVGCAGGDDKSDADLIRARVVEGTADSSEESAQITYQKHLRPILETRCVSCHKPGGIGPMRLDEWSTVRRFAPSIVDAVKSGSMPPWPASASCQEVADSGELPDGERVQFGRWEDGGYLEGDSRDYVAVQGPARAELGAPTRVLTAAESFTPAPNSDTYRCFKVGALDVDTYLTAVQIVPGQRAEVHHAQLHRVEPESVARLDALDAAEPGGGWTCNSNGVTADVAPASGQTGAADQRMSSQNLFSYRPGSVPVTFSEGDAVYLKGGSVLVLQMHYNTQFLSKQTSPQPDQSRVDVWTLPDGARPRNVIHRMLLSSPLNRRGDGTFDTIQKSTIPANGKSVGWNEYTMGYLSHVTRGFRGNGTISDYLPGEIVGITPHAHTWAKRMTSILVPAAGANACLVDVPRWDYAWQFDYLFRKGVPFTPDDVLHVECNFSNTADDQPVVNGQTLPVRTISYGERTLDEMCVHYLWLRYKYEDFANVPFSPWVAATSPPPPVVPVLPPAEQ